MRLFRIFKGEAFEICSFEQERESSVRKLLDDLEENDPSEYRALMTRIRHIAQSGQPANNRQMRPLKGKNAEKLFEIKTTSGSRVICFYEKGKLIICTHGFHKIKDIQLKRYIKSAQKERGEYLKWTQSKA
ncbi:MAG: type II toxin-antitoxin system RelE/ParE family toxin [Candidatus Hinthialibacter antarcticus]|nr:type II toxin-antitoxin system RelE/ParE family toxin [Candidatus Hinthialibacter antarcticus]